MASRGYPYPRRDSRDVPAVVLHRPPLPGRATCIPFPTSRWLAMFPQVRHLCPHHQGPVLEGEEVFGDDTRGVFNGLDLRLPGGSKGVISGIGFVLCSSSITSIPSSWNALSLWYHCRSSFRTKPFSKPIWCHLRSSPLNSSDQTGVLAFRLSSWSTMSSAWPGSPPVVCRQNHR